MALVRLALIVSTLLAVACVGAPVAINRTLTDPRSYTVGEPIETPTGGVMIWWQGDSLLPTYVNPESILPVGIRRPISAGLQWTALWLYLGSECEGGEYVITSPDWYRAGLGFIIDGAGVTACSRPVIRLKGRFLIFSPQTWELKWPVKFEKGSNSEGVLHQLVYTGMSGRTMMITHREFAATARLVGGSVRSSAHAREAFYLDLQYDLDESERIRFREIEMVVHEATPERIVFMVLEDGSAQ